MIIILILGISIFILIYTIKKSTNDNLKEIIKERDLVEDFFVSVGALYDEKQDIIYSSIDSWQRKYGYCSLYDKFAWILYMSIDCEPIYFEYNGEMWLIEFWKGQYAVATGCEIGIYKSSELQMPSKKVFFYTIEDKDMIEMEFILKRDNEVLFQRKEKHWWLTGFRFGEYSNPNSLSMDISLNFKDRNMLIAFENSLKKIGYSNIEVKDNDVSFNYNKPKTKQYFFRRSILNYVIQIINKYVCKRYNKIVRNADNIKDKVELLRSHNKKMFIKILKVLLSRRIFS